MEQQKHQRITQNSFVKFILELKLWSFRNMKILRIIRESIGKYVCGINCEACKAQKFRRQFSMTPDEVLELLTVSFSY